MVPWEDVTLVGTTDLDHRQTLDEEPAISPDEVAYLMAAVEAVFPALALTLDDIVATYSGVRPVVDTGKADPSKEARDHLVLEEQGLVTVTGGKLTTFRLLAHDALVAAQPRLPRPVTLDQSGSLFEQCRRPAAGVAAREQRASACSAGTARRPRRSWPPRARASWRPSPACRRCGPSCAGPHAARPWCHLDDLLLRRVRLGLQLPEGGAALLPELRAICQEELGWDDAALAG